MKLSTVFRFVGLTLGVLLLLNSAGTSGVGLAQKTITVCPSGCEFSKIQDAINAAAEGDTIQVRAGTYRENLRITKGVTLQGKDKDEVLLQGTVAILGTKLVTFSGFTVKGGRGVQIEDSLTIALIDNSFVESTAEGVFVRDSSITMRGNLISGNKSHGLLLTLGSRVSLTDNHISNNGGDGVNLAASQADLRDSIIRDNAGCGVRADTASLLSGQNNEVLCNSQGSGCDRAIFPEGFLKLKAFALAEHHEFDAFRSVTFSPNGRLLAFGFCRQWSSSNSCIQSEIKLWDAAVCTEVHTYSGHTDAVLSLAFSPNGQLLASGSQDKTIKLWWVNGFVRNTLEGHSGWVWSVAFSPDGRLLASGSCGQRNQYSSCIQGEIKLWEVASGQVVRTLSGHSSDVTSVAFSPDGRLLASSSYGDIILWEVGTGREVRTLRGYTSWVHSIAFSPDGRLLASGSQEGPLPNGMIKLWEVATGREKHTLEQEDIVSSVAISSSWMLAFSSFGRRSSVNLWNIQDLLGR